MATTVPTVKLPSGAEFPVIGFGTWKSKPGQVEVAVKAAIDVGYRHIDCAMCYNNEKEVGSAIKAKIDDGTVKREDLFITSKLWNTRHRPSDVKSSLMESMADLGVDYLDLYLIHWPQPFKSGKDMFPKGKDGNVLYDDIHPRDTFKAMEKCVEEGLVRDIGLSNFNSEQVQDIIDNCKIKPATNQVELHPYFNNRKLSEYCTSRGVIMTAYSPLGSADRPWASKDEPLLLEDPRLTAVAGRLGKSPAQVVLRYLYSLGVVIIPKSVTPSRIAENFNILDFELSKEDIEVMESFNKNERIMAVYVEVDGKRVMRDRKAPHFPFNIEF